MWAIAGAMSIVLAGCQSSATAPSPISAVTSVTVTSASTGAATFQLAAMARRSDGTTLDVTRDAAWLSSNPLFATVAPGGLVAVVASGEVDLRATYDNVSGSVHLVVARLFSVVAVTISGGQTSGASFQLTATARLSDGSALDVTRVAAWDSSDTTDATVSSIGVVNVVSDGDVDIRAAYQGATGSSHLSVRLPRYAVRGVVHAAGPGGTPVAGASVRLLEPSIIDSPTVTDASGAFTFSAVPTGRHLIEVSANGYAIYEASLLIVDGDLNISVTLNAAAALSGGRPRP